MQQPRSSFQPDTFDRAIKMFSEYKYADKKAVDVFRALCEMDHDAPVQPAYNACKYVVLKGIRHTIDKLLKEDMTLLGTDMRSYMGNQGNELAVEATPPQSIVQDASATEAAQTTTTTTTMTTMTTNDHEHNVVAHQLPESKRVRNIESCETPIASSGGVPGATTTAATVVTKQEQQEEEEEARGDQNRRPD